MAKDGHLYGPDLMHRRQAARRRRQRAPAVRIPEADTLLGYATIPRRIVPDKMQLACSDCMAYQVIT